MDGTTQSDIVTVRWDKLVSGPTSAAMLGHAGTHAASVSLPPQAVSLTPLDSDGVLKMFPRSPNRQVMTYLKSLPRDPKTGFPLRCQFNPCELRLCLEWLVLMDVVSCDSASRARPDYRYRLVGEGVRKMHAGNAVGKSIYEFLGQEQADSLAGIFAALLDDGQPKACRIVRHSRNGSYDFIATFWALALDDGSKQIIVVLSPVMLSMLQGRGDRVGFGRVPTQAGYGRAFG